MKRMIPPNEYDPTDPVGRLLFNVLNMVAEFESDLMRMRTRGGMAITRAQGRLRGRQPKLSALQRRHSVSLHEQGEHSQAELAELFRVARSTVYRTIQRESTKRTDWVLPHRGGQLPDPPVEGGP